ncbi:hypothetical protein BS47DRAFT_1384889 [Hydnum rufescens UP504]|uniref:Uncharacterized protein n=1 Tax=Hydnum rufescens UP504 TaxID=1448309 RepID=A0A9P6ALR3_9AGAM|nr:hypothetical protein BS47DRAFT_1384889 [Hydnum rufescens UP504]
MGGCLSICPGNSPGPPSPEGQKTQLFYAIYFPREIAPQAASSSREPVISRVSPEGNVQSKDPYSRIAACRPHHRPDQFPVTQPEPVRGNTSLSNNNQAAVYRTFSIPATSPESTHFRQIDPFVISSPSHEEPSQESPITPVGRDPPVQDPPTRAEAIRPDLNPSQGRMCVAVDFGTVLSGVACGQSSDRSSRFYGLDQIARFKLLLDPNGASDLIPRIFPLGKGPIDVITDYLRELWQNAKPKILWLGYTKEALQSADIWLSIPATWNVRNGEMMRDAAYAAGLVAREGSQEYAGGRDRLHIISSRGCTLCPLEGSELKPNQSFMVCDAGGGTIDTAIYQVLGNVTQIAECCASSGASCGSHFLDIYFRAYLEENLSLMESRAGGISILSASTLPIIVLRVLEAQLKRGGSVDALVLVGGFSASPYLFERIWRLHGRILNPIDPDIATSLGATQSGLAESLIQRPIGAPTIIASKSYIIGIGPNLATSPGGNRNSGSSTGCDDGLQQVFGGQGALLRKGEPVLHEFTKTSSSPSDSVFVARVYSSDSAEIRADTSGGYLEHIHDWEIDLSDTSLFKYNVQNAAWNRFDTVFEIGVEIDSQAFHEKTHVPGGLLIGGIHEMATWRRCIKIRRALKSTIGGKLCVLGFWLTPELSPTGTSPAGRPNLATSPGGNRNSGSSTGMMMGFNNVFEAQYLVVKGALLRKGEPVLHEFTKTSSSPSDSVFVARVYSSDSAEIRADTSGGYLEHIHDWEIDLSDTSLFKYNVQNAAWNRFDTVFEIGVEIDSQDRGVHMVDREAQKPTLTLVASTEQSRITVAKPPSVRYSGVALLCHLGPQGACPVPEWVTIGGKTSV